MAKLPQSAEALAQLVALPTGATEARGVKVAFNCTLKDGCVMSQLPWLEPDAPFPPACQAWGADDPAPGLLAAGGALNVPTLCRAYRSGIFPWFSAGQPILWWSPDPRMVLQVADFKLHRSFRKTLAQFIGDAHCEIRVDTAFDTVIQNCADSARPGQDGTWIVPAMVQAYQQLHRAGHAHSVETWVNGELVGGLYAISMGRAVFGESMFARVSGASKLALAALVALCRHHGVTQIDCQQNTPHLASLGARETSRADFLDTVDVDAQKPGFDWKFDAVYWTHLLPQTTPA